MSVETDARLLFAVRFQYDAFIRSINAVATTEATRIVSTEVPAHVKAISVGDIANWDAAFGWGDHALAGYLTSFTETDPVFAASPAAGIAALDITNWNTAFGWGDHAGLYEPVFAKNTGFNKDFGSVAGTVTEGDDARLSDARTPLAHVHGTSEITDYDEGTWSPVFTPAAGAFTTMTMEVLSANYVKIGSLVHVEAYIRTTGVNLSGGSGSLYLSGLPFTAAGNATLALAFANDFASATDSPWALWVLSGGTRALVLTRAAPNGNLSAMNVLGLESGVIVANKLVLTGSYKAA